MNAMRAQQVVYVVDDDEAVLDSLQVFLTSAGLNTKVYSDPARFLADYRQSFAGCLVLDIHLPAISGLGLQEELIAIGSTLPIIFITGHGDVRTAVQAMKAGAFEFLEKPFSQQQLLDHIERALALDARTRENIDKQQQVRERYATLTPRETEVLGFVVSGKATKVMALEMGISQRTVEIYRANIMHKMQSRSVAQLVKMLGDSGVKPGNQA